MKKRIMLICIIALIGTFVFGCTAKKDEPPVSNVGTEQQEEYEAGEQITLYSYNAERDEQMTTVYELQPGEAISVENVVKAYQNQIMDGLYKKVVAINSITIKESNNGVNVWIDFKADDVISLGLGSGSEGSYYGDLARSIEANIAEVNCIYYSMDGKNFETGHLLFETTEPFWIRTNGPEE